MGEVKEIYRIYEPADMANLVKQLNEQLERISEEVAPLKAYQFRNVAKPSVLSGDLWQTGGTTKIVELKDGVPWQTIRIFSRHSVTIEHNDNIQLQGTVDYEMVDGDHIELIQKDDGVWYEVKRGGAAPSSSGSSNPLTVGINDIAYGRAYLYGHAAGSTNGGELRLYLAADHDGSISYYRIKAISSDLQIGPDTDPDSLKYDSDNVRWVFTAGDLRLGVNDTIAARLDLYGGATGSTQGGEINMYLAKDHTSPSYYQISVSSTDWLFGPSTNNDALKYIKATDTWAFTVPFTDVNSRGFRYSFMLGG